MTVTGENFSPDAGTVTFRFSSQAGPVLTRATPNSAGEVSASFRVPEAAPGSYVLLATQVSDGEPAFGTPARSVVVVPGPNGNAALPSETGQDVNVTVSPEPTAAPDTGERLSTVLLVVTGIAGVTLFVAGLAAFAASVRRRPEPQVQR